MVRQNNGRKEKTSFCIIDAQSVKNTDTAEEKGYDAGKKISGIKRHIAVDTQGLPHAIYVTTAGTTDRSSAVNPNYGLASKERHRNRGLFRLHGIGNQNRKNMN